MRNILKIAFSIGGMMVALDTSANHGVQAMGEAILILIQMSALALLGLIFIIAALIKPSEFKLFILAILGLAKLIFILVRLPLELEFIFQEWLISMSPIILLFLLEIVIFIRGYNRLKASQ